jgi:hypothetical protein
MTAKLRIGLLLDSVSLPAWAFTAVERMIRSTHVELALVALNQPQSTSGSAGQELQRNSLPWLYRVFNTIDEKLFLRGPNALKQVDTSEIFSQVPVMNVTPIDENEEQHFSASDVGKIKSYKLDVLVKMGFGKLHGDVLSAAAHGIWTYRWGDSRKIEDGLTGFWEVVRGWPETGASLQHLGASAESDVTLFESWFFTYPYSPARNRNYVLWAAASFLPRQVERLHRLGGEKFFQDPKNRVDDNPRELKSNDFPSNLLVLWIIMKLAFTNLLEVLRRSFYREQWELLFTFGQEVGKDLSTFKRISPPQDCFWADPHIIYREPNFYVFIEEYPYRTKRGHISVIEMDRNGNYKPPIPVLREDSHLSFPFVFDWMGQYYMIPESSERKTIDLYECIVFPDRWQYKMTLMKDVKAVDSTVFYIHGKWWLFTAMAEQEAAAPQVELFLFYSTELFTDQWDPHPMNPIVSDVKKARGAGSILLKAERLLRPSQYCSSTYGYGFDLNEIDILSETEYSERTVKSVRPDPAKRIIATHTYANQANLTVVDALRRRPKWAKTA